MPDEAATIIARCADAARAAVTRWFVDNVYMHSGLPLETYVREQVRAVPIPGLTRTHETDHP